MSCTWIFVPEASKTSALLQSLSEHFIFADVIVTDRTTSKSHRLLKMILPDLWDWIKVLVLQTTEKTHYRDFMEKQHSLYLHTCVCVCVCVPSPKADSYKTHSRPLGNVFIFHSLHLYQALIAWYSFGQWRIYIYVHLCVCFCVCLSRGNTKRDQIISLLFNTV